MYTGDEDPDSLNFGYPDPILFSFTKYKLESTNS